MIGIVLAVIDTLLLGTANVLLKKSYKDFSSSVSFFIFSIFSLITWGGLGLIMGVDFSNLLFGLFIGFVSAILGQAIYIYVLGKGELSITATILSTYSVYTIIFSILFNHESLSQAALIFVVLAILGTLIVSLPEKDQFHKKDLKNIGLIAWAVFAAICIGGADTLTKYYLNTASIGSFLFYTAIAQFLVSFVYLKLENEPLSQFKNIFHQLSEYKYALLGSLGISTATMTLFLAFNYAIASIVSPISASYPVVTILLALIFLKEKLSLKNSLGLILVIVAIIGVGFISS